MFPTRHWRNLTGQLTAGQRAVVAHGLRDGRNGTAIIPDAVLLNMGTNVNGGITSHTNLYVEQYAGADTTNVYLSNVDPANTHPYSIVARSYYSDDDANF